MIVGCVGRGVVERLCRLPPEDVDSKDEALVLRLGGDNVSEVFPLYANVRDDLCGDLFNTFVFEGVKRAASFEPKDGGETATGICGSESDGGGYDGEFGMASSLWGT